MPPDACSPDPCAASNRACALGSDGKADCGACKQGFALPQTDPDNGKCEDVNECDSPSTCPGRTCTNTQGDFKCGACTDGFNEVDGECVDKDECAAPINLCKDVHRVCFNFYEGKGAECLMCEDGYLETRNLCIEQPKCGKGYQLDVLQCVNIDECAAGTDDCGANTYCSDTDGGFECNCRDGYKPSGNRDKTCIDIDECAAGLDDCGAHASCSNTIGSYNCFCSAGYQLSGDLRTCDDIDECAAGTDGCGEACCSNTDGSFKCIAANCNAGYEPSADCKTCVDIDECTVGVYFNGNLISPCDDTPDSNGQDRGICTNTPGSYGCVCRADANSWVGDGKNLLLGSGCTGGCFPGSAKLWVKSGIFGAVQRQIKDVRIGDYVRCATAPSQGYDFPAVLDWCWVASWIHANHTQHQDHRKVTYRRADGSTGSHTLTDIHYLYVLPSNVKVGTRLDSLDSLKGTHVLPDSAPAGAKLATGVRSTSGVYDGFEVVEVVSVEPDNDAIGWYLFQTDSPFVMVDDVVAANGVRYSYAKEFFPQDTDMWASRFWFAFTIDSWTSRIVEAPVGTSGYDFIAKRAPIYPSRVGTLFNISRMVGLEGYKYNVETFWSWWLPKYEAWLANPGSPDTVVSRQQVVDAMLSALVPPQQEAKVDAA